jgi:hypothetical protein
VFLTSKPPRRFQPGDVPILAGIVGVALVSWGAFQAWPPAGPMVAGAFLIAFYVVREKRDKR